MQRKKKRSIIFELHSIPINIRKYVSKFFSRSLCNKRLYLVSYSIPLSCIAALLLVLGMSIGVRSHYDVQVSVLETDGAAREGSSVTLTVGGDALDKTVETGINEVAYRKHTVDVSVTDMMDYYLVLAGDPNLTLQTTQTYTVPTIESNVLGAEMPENRWGFAWEKDGNTEAEALTYQPITTANTTLESDNALASGSGVNFSGQLNFAAKFGDSAALGKYTSKVSLSLIATPKTVSTAAYWKNTAGDMIGAGVESGTMQGIEADFCSNPAVKENYTIELKDARDGNTYTIVKLKDGKCWMQQNLRLVAEKDEGLGLTENDTDINGNWTLPKTLVGTGTSVSEWKNYNIEPYSATFNNMEYGTYYNWCAATAGTCVSANSDGQIAAGSICPKGWHLPTGGGSGTTGTGEFGVLNGLNSTTVQQGSYSFPAAGLVNSGSLTNAGSYGDYWSSTVYSDAYAYDLNFGGSNFNPGTYNRYRYYGFPVRCVADEGTGIWIMPDSTTLKTDLHNMQDITKANFSEKYCANTTTANTLVLEGSAMNLRDIRDRKIYTVYKAADGNCWMGQNLALSGPIDLNSDDTDLVAGATWTLPVDTTTWSTSNDDAVQVKTGSARLSGWKNGFGNYYSWPAATAGTGTTAVVNTDAVASICPKGWKLPTKYGDYSFNTLTSAMSDWITNAFYHGNSGISGRYLGSKKTDVYKGANFWPAAGTVSRNDSIDSVNSYGRYWSSAANTSGVAFIQFVSNYSNENGARMSLGLSMRCIAEPSE